MSTTVHIWFSLIWNICLIKNSAYNVFGFELNCVSNKFYFSDSAVRYRSRGGFLRLTKYSKLGKVREEERMQINYVFSLIKLNISPLSVFLLFCNVSFSSIIWDESANALNKCYKRRLVPISFVYVQRKK